MRLVWLTCSRNWYVSTPSSYRLAGYHVATLTFIALLDIIMYHQHIFGKMCHWLCYIGRPFRGISLYFSALARRRTHSFYPLCLCAAAEHEAGEKRAIASHLTPSSNNLCPFSVVPVQRDPPTHKVPNIVPAGWASICWWIMEMMRHVAYLLY